MAYATQQDIINRYGEDQLLILADRDNDGEADEAVVARALADADSEIEGRIGTRYDLPLAVVPDMLVQVAVDIAIYRLCHTPDLATEEIRIRYKDARDTLKDVAKGLVTLGAVPEKSAGQASGPAIVSGPPRLFGRGRNGGLP